MISKRNGNARRQKNSISDPCKVNDVRCQQLLHQTVHFRKIIGVAVGTSNKGVIELGEVIVWGDDKKGEIVWGLEYDTSVIYVPFDELLHAQKVAALLPKAMLLASETVRVLVHTSKGVMMIGLRVTKLR